MHPVVRVAFPEGWAHSCQAWIDSRLAAEVYGFAIGRVHSAESLFQCEDDIAGNGWMALVEKAFELGFRVVDRQRTVPS